jgi:hypothetical protein
MNKECICKNDKYCENCLELIDYKEKKNNFFKRLLDFILKPFFED